MKRILLLILIASAWQGESFGTVYTVNANTWTNTGAATSGDLLYCINKANADVSAGPHRIVFSATVTFPIVYSPVTIGNAGQQIIIDGETALGWSCGNPKVILQRSAGYAQNVFTLQGLGVVLKSLIFQGANMKLTAGTSEIYGCWFNLNAAGTAASVSVSADAGIFMTISGGSNHILGSDDCNRNVFSMNGTGVWQTMVSVSGANGTTFNGNYFGTDKTGLVALSDYNGGNGIIKVEGSVSNLTITNNVLSCALGNLGRAVSIISNFNVTGLTITNNKVGLDANGNVAAGFGNANGGLVLIGNCTGSNITISNNDIGSNGYGNSDINSCGMIITSSFSNVAISNNYVGTTRAYANAGNAFAGIFVTSAISTLSITGNVIGYNGFGPIKSHGGEITNCSNVTFSNNFVGVSPTGLDIANSTTGFTFASCSNASITNNYVCFNQGQRSIPNAAIVVSGGSDITLRNNSIGVTPAGGAGGQKNLGGHARGGMGVLVEDALRVRIGGMNSGDQNWIANSAGNGINCYKSSSGTCDFIEMRWNSIFCNGAKGISLNYGSNAANAGLAAPVLTGPNPNLPTTISGTKPANTLVDVFGTATCSVNCVGLPQGEKYKGEATSYASGTAGTQWTFSPGGSIYDFITVLATGVTGTANCTATGIAACRTTEFSVCDDNILPVQFTHVGAEITGSQVLVSWSTGYERDNDFFVLMRSGDGIDFVPLAIVSAKGNSGFVSTYHFTDHAPLEGNNFYKIKQVDTDGAYAFSEVVKADPGCSFLSVYPNPASGSLQLVLCDYAESALISVYDLAGRLIMKYILTGDRVNLDVSALFPGSYFMQINDGKTVKTVRFAVN